MLAFFHNGNKIQYIFHLVFVSLYASLRVYGLFHGFFREETIGTFYLFAG